MKETITLVGGGVAGMAAASALAEKGFAVQLVERKPHLGGRASSYLHRGVAEEIDNCQHVLFGCCTNLIGFYKRIGVADRITWTTDMTMIEPGGRRSPLGPSFLPAPLHSLPRFLTARAFTLGDKLALARAFAALLRPIPPDSPESLASWLARHHQTSGALTRFWRLVIASALNSDLESISLPYAAKVIRELFMNSARAGSMGMSSVPLGRLYAGAHDFLAARGATVQCNTAVESATWDESAGQWTVLTPSGPITSTYLILALPFEGLAKLLPNLPAVKGSEELAAQLRGHEHWPICSVHLWFDREITTLDHAVLLDREVHWMYNKSRLQPERSQAGSYLELVVSASRTFASLSSEEAIALAVRELGEFFPVVREAMLIKAVFIKEVKATFTVRPGIDACRPTAVSPWPNCFLAGDWTATGWPSTMESAARSGHLAAQALCRSRGEVETFLLPDLEPEGLMRVLAPTSP